MTPHSGAGPGLKFWGEDVPKTLTFRVWAGFLSLACNNPAVLPDENTVVFRCSDSILVMDFARRRVGRLVHGDRLALKLPQFSEGDRRVYAREDTSGIPVDANGAAPASTTQSTVGDAGSIEAAKETIEQARRAGIDYRQVLRQAERGNTDALAQLMAVSTETDAAGALGQDPRPSAEWIAQRTDDSFMIYSRSSDEIRSYETEEAWRNQYRHAGYCVIMGSSAALALAWIMLPLLPGLERYEFKFTRRGDW